MAKAQSSEETHLIKALARLLRPLVRFLLSRGFTYTRLIQVLRPLYVEIAEAEYQRKNEFKNPTDSRVSLMTGIARRYVKELRDSNTSRSTGALKASLGVRVIAEWTTNSNFLSKNGTPLKLEKLARDNNDVSFEGLVTLVTSDVKSRTVLDDLVSKGMVLIQKNGLVVLKKKVYKPDKNRTELIDYFGMHIHDHIAAATNNLYESPDLMFERSAFMDNLSEESIEELNKLIDEGGMELLKTIYSRASELSRNDSDSEVATKRFRLGIYSYHVDEKDE